MNCDSEHCAIFYGPVIIFVFQTPTLKTKKAEKGTSRLFFKLSSPQSRFHRLLTIYTYTRTVLFIKRGRCFIYLYKYNHNLANSTVKKYICIDAERSFKTCLDKYSLASLTKNKFWLKIFYIKQRLPPKTEFL